MYNPVIVTGLDKDPAEIARLIAELREEHRDLDEAITRLSIDYITKLSDTFYGRISGGLLERMYAGISAELLWKPTGRSWGTGLELNFVRQRGFNSQFDLRNYETLTGHASCVCHVLMRLAGR